MLVGQLGAFLVEPDRYRNQQRHISGRHADVSAEDLSPGDGLAPEPLPVRLWIARVPGETVVRMVGLGISYPLTIERLVYLSGQDERFRYLNHPVFLRSPESRTLTQER